MKKVVFFTFLFCFKLYAVTEVSADFSYEKDKFGVDNNSQTVNRVYSSSLAFYFASRTAFEFHYTYDDERTTNNASSLVSGTLSQIQSFDQVNTVVWGIGVRQAFTSRKAAIKPLLSLGYARQIIKGGGNRTYFNSAGSTTTQINLEEYKAQLDSVFATFAVQFRLSDGLSLRSSVYSVFEAFKWSEAKNDLKYKVGFSWMF